MNTAVLIRQAELADIPALLGLLKLLFSIEKDFIFDAGKQEQGLRMLLAESRAVVLVAETDGQIVGMCTGQLLISTAQGSSSVLVEDVVVLPSWQGQGIGKLLLAALSEWAVSQGARRMQLLADRNNTPALAFYRNMGLQTTEMICLQKFLKENGNARQNSSGAADRAPAD
ncbi:MAG: Ribosomal protein S18 acetylase RimI [Candidatus Electronema aureum]|uniref:Ribosomal protein S18 acetylase RimI n=1 Tax=Candidatus Electronema aureum TaxID=2005002 RepID=A0A521G2X6_9BACT|nr:MAG: Ribosomal protein S18 acetylase RimI [Candidatus Electronema aureum]